MEISVLWIEDSNDWFVNQKRHLVRELEKLGFTASIYRTRRGENLSRYLSKPLDFALCDYNLQDGVDELSVSIIAKIRAKNKYCRIIFYTGDAMLPPEILEKLVRSGICRFVSRNELTAIAVEEIEGGLNIYAVVDKWLTYYGRDKKKSTFSLLGKPFAKRTIGELTQNVRRGTDLGRAFSYELTRYMISMIVD